MGLWSGPASHDPLQPGPHQRHDHIPLAEAIVKDRPFSYAKVSDMKEMKYILITGGVISGIGKGVVASSLGVLLKHCGVEVTSIKIDPYINIGRLLLTFIFVLIFSCNSILLQVLILQQVFQIYCWLHCPNTKKL